MNDEPIRLEPSEGQPVPTSSAERVVVGFAALALLSGVVIALGNALGPLDQTNVASSGAPAPIARASETRRPTRSPRPLREFWLQPGAPERAEEPFYWFWGLIRATENVTIRRDPQAGAPEVGLLAAGQLAMAEEWPEVAGDGGWLHIIGPEPRGWVAEMRENGPVIERLAPPAVPVSGEVWGLSAGAEGFLASAWSAGQSDQPQRQFVASSSDGLSWHESESAASSPSDIRTAAWGPAGWLALEAAYQNGAGIWVWQSANGVSWSALGAMEDLPGGAYPAQMVGSARGYLMATEYGPRFWFSPDGITWSESADSGLGFSRSMSITAGARGFYAWDRQPVALQSGARAAFSLDGRTWSAVTYGPEGASTQVVAVGDGWLATDTDPSTGSPRIWIGAVADDHMTWRRDRLAQVEFEGSTISALASDGSRAVAFGWDRLTEQPLVWTAHAGEWTLSLLPSDFGGIPRLATGGPRGFVAVGYRPTLRGSNPAFWHSRDGEVWSQEPSPLFALASDPSSEDCGPPPTDGFELFLMDRASAPLCYGATPLTLRAWSGRCGWCLGNRSGQRQPHWLAEPGRNQLNLSPLEGLNDGPTQVVLDPTVEFDRAWVGTWVEVTGHFDDPASMTCTWTPLEEELQWYSGRQQVIDTCRQQFVVTSLTVIEGE